MSLVIPFLLLKSNRHVKIQYFAKFKKILQFFVNFVKKSVLVILLCLLFSGNKKEGYQSHFKVLSLKAKIRGVPNS